MPRFSLSRMLLGVAALAAALAFVVTLQRLRNAESELAALRLETGYLAPSEPSQIAAVRLTSDEPMTFRVRVRVPESSSSTAPNYRIAYSSVWQSGATAPTWFAAISVPPGESVVILRILKDPRDDRWKITTLRRSQSGTRRLATVLPEDHVQLFRGSHEWLSTGVPRETQFADTGQSLRLLDERILSGEGAMMLYGDRPPESDMIGVYAELQPDVGPL